MSPTDNVAYTVESLIRYAQGNGVPIELGRTWWPMLEDLVQVHLRAGKSRLTAERLVQTEIDDVIREVKSID